MPNPPCLVQAICRGPCAAAERGAGRPLGPTAPVQRHQRLPAPAAAATRRGPRELAIRCSSQEGLAQGTGSAGCSPRPSQSRCRAGQAAWVLILTLHCSHRRRGPGAHAGRSIAGQSPPSPCTQLSSTAWRHAGGHVAQLAATSSHALMHLLVHSCLMHARFCLSCQGVNCILRLQDESASSVDTAAAAVAKFEPKAAAGLLEEEIREAVVGSVGSAVGEITRQRHSYCTGCSGCATVRSCGAGCCV